MKQDRITAKVLSEIKKEDVPGVDVYKFSAILIKDNKETERVSIQIEAHIYPEHREILSKGKIISFQVDRRGFLIKTSLREF